MAKRIAALKSNFGKELQRANLETRIPTMIRASSLGMCRRRIGYDILGYMGIPENSHNIITLDTGEALHIMLQKYLVKLGWINSILTVKDNELCWENPTTESGCEIPFVDEKLRIRGRCDGITVPLKYIKEKNEIGSFIPDKDGTRYLVEIKSISDRNNFAVLGILDGGTEPISDETATFLELDTKISSSGKQQQILYDFSHSRPVKTKFGLRNCPVYNVLIGGEKRAITVLFTSNIYGRFSNLKKPADYHIPQASLYAKHFGLKDILFIYIGKDVNPQLYDTNSLFNAPIKIFHHVVNPIDTLLIETKVKEIYESVDKGELPENDIEKGSSDCFYCPYKWQCLEQDVNIDLLNAELTQIGRPALKKGPVLKKAP